MYEEIKNDAFFKLLIKRDKASFKRLYELFKIPLYKIVNAITKNDEKTADIIQDTFIKAIRKISQLKDIEKIDFWIYKIAINLTLNSIQRDKRIFFTEDRIDSFVDRETADQYVKIESSQSQENYFLLMELIEELPIKFKIIISLKYIENLKEAEISEILDIPVGTVKSRLNIARTRLKKLLHEYNLKR